MVEEVLTHVRNRLLSGSTLDDIAPIVAPKIRFGSPRGLYHQPVDEIVQTLIKQYLDATPRRERVKLEDKVLVKKAEHELDTLISDLPDSEWISYAIRSTTGSTGKGRCGPSHFAYRGWQRRCVATAETSSLIVC
jgi:hypothetical protein